jgi:hypothetical protein
MADSELDAIADAADFYLEESGFFFMPTQKVMQAMAEERRAGFLRRAISPNDDGGGRGIMNAYLPPRVYETTKC